MALIHEDTWEKQRAKLRAESELDKPRVLSEQPAALEKFLELWIEDTGSYSFRCDRYGDFLALYISRHGKKIVSAVNIANSAITLQPGSKPDLKGGLHCYSNGGALEWRTPWFPMMGPPKTGFPGIFIVDAAPTQNTSFGGAVMMNSGEVQFNYVDNCARDAIDDSIRFEAARSTLLVPAGLGQSVLTQILSAIAT